MATSKQQKVEDIWNTLEGRLGSLQCTVLEVAVVTKQQTKQEEEEIKLDHMSNIA